LRFTHARWARGPAYSPPQSPSRQSLRHWAVFAGTYITEVEVHERALAWVPEVTRIFGGTSEIMKEVISRSL
jgi:hypothetical protein